MSAAGLLCHLVNQSKSEPLDYGCGPRAPGDHHFCSQYLAKGLPDLDSFPEDLGQATDAVRPYPAHDRAARPLGQHLFRGPLGGLRAPRQLPQVARASEALMREVVPCPGGELEQIQFLFGHARSATPLSRSPLPDRGAFPPRASFRQIRLPVRDNGETRALFAHPVDQHAAIAGKRVVRVGERSLVNHAVDELLFCAKYRPFAAR